MNSQTHGGECFSYSSKNFPYCIRQRSAVGIAQRDTVRSAGRRSPQDLYSIGGITAISIEGVFSVKYDLSALFLKKTYGPRNEVQIFRERDAQHMVYMKIPCFAEHGYHGGLCPHQTPQTFVLYCRDSRSVCASESTQPGMLQRDFADLFKKILFLGV